MPDPVNEVVARAVTELSGPNLVLLTHGGRDDTIVAGMDERLRNETGIPVTVADDPLLAVVNGCGRCIDEWDTLKRVFVPDHR